ncbi:hypothetical protein DFP72DRAFT_899371 [Ephemerocybe angulata]|uniref:Uncharacterized protein n=1 Tax=Ephemerocybe angulata TaxID=980116 RepID=A0A8H6HWK3_9AGAR|nr:hypothetical protein DFP72DRAFT_899371 [Tulosesus angulatus]
MSSILRNTATRASKQLAAASGVRAVRAFHTPFAVLGPSPLPSSSGSANSFAAQYEKQYDTTHEPFVSSSGHRTYVVSEPDASYKHYAVPAGAYPTSAPYVQFAATEAPELQYDRNDVSSTAADILAHPFTASAALNEASAEKRGASGAKRLSDRNPQPDGPAAAKFSKGGVQNAWKMRI